MRPSIEIYKIGYEDALPYFNEYSKAIELLSGLDEDEKEDFIFEIHINNDERSAECSIGNRRRSSRHLYENSDLIDETTWFIEDYDAVLDFLRNNGERD